MRLAIAILVLLAVAGCGSQEPTAGKSPQQLEADKRASLQAEEARYHIKVGP